jgi:hypothetical protein
MQTRGGGQGDLKYSLNQKNLIILVRVCLLSPSSSPSKDGKKSCTAVAFAQFFTKSAWSHACAHGDMRMSKEQHDKGMEKVANQ